MRPSWHTRQADKRWVLASTLVCALAGLVSVGTDPLAHREPRSAPVKEQPRRAVSRSVPDVVLPTAPHDRGERLPSPPVAAALAERPRFGDQRPAPIVMPDGASSGGEPPRAAFPRP